MACATLTLLIWPNPDESPPTQTAQTRHLPACATADHAIQVCQRACVAWSACVPRFWPRCCCAVNSGASAKPRCSNLRLVAERGPILFLGSQALLPGETECS